MQYNRRAHGNALFEDTDDTEATAAAAAAKIYGNPQSLSLLKSLLSQTRASFLLC